MDGGECLRCLCVLVKGLSRIQPQDIICLWVGDYGEESRGAARYGYLRSPQPEQSSRVERSWLVWSSGIDTQRNFEKGG